MALCAEDEWVAEAYMRTDYSTVADQLFEDTLHGYSTYLFHSPIPQPPAWRRERRQNRAEGRPVDRPIALAAVRVDGLVRCGGHDNHATEGAGVHRAGGFPYVTTQATNNGVDGFYGESTEAGGVITVDSAVVGFCAYQEKAFSASDHVEKLTPRFDMTAPLAMFLATLLNMEQYRYNYGLKRAQKRLRRESLRLPCTKRGTPDWRCMERYIGGLRYSRNLPR